MKILLCHKFLFPLGGAERYILDLRHGLASAGHQVIDFSTTDARNVYSAYAAYFAGHQDFSSVNWRNPLDNLRKAINFIHSEEARQKITRLIDRYQPDVAHIHSIYHHISGSILSVLHRRRIPVIMTVHDYKLLCPNYSFFTRNQICEACLGGNYLNAITRRCLKNSILASILACAEMYYSKLFKIYSGGIDLFIAPSRFVERKLIEAKVPSRKIVYVPYAIDLSGFSAGTEPGKYVLYFGNLSEKKGMMTLLKSACFFKEIPVKIIGDGPQRKELEQFCSKNGLTRVEFLGYVRKEELPGFIRNSFFVVVPSRWFEVAGLVIYEAFSCGKCVVASDLGGIPETVIDQVTGLLFSAGDAAGLAEKIRFLLDNPLQARALGNNAMAHIKKINDQQGHCQKLAGLYQQEIDKKSG